MLPVHRDLQRLSCKALKKLLAAAVEIQAPTPARRQSEKIYDFGAPV